MTAPRLHRPAALSTALLLALTCAAPGATAQGFGSTRLLAAGQPSGSAKRRVEIRKALP